MYKPSSKFGSIYKITNIRTNKVYIGQTVLSIKGRFKEHCKPNSRSISAINNSIQKHGKETFIIEELCCAVKTEYLDELECQFIQDYKCLAPNGYNLREGGSNGHLHESTKRKLSNALKGKPSTGRTKKGWGHYQNKPVTARCCTTGIEVSYPSIEITKELGFCPTVVRMCVKHKGRSKSHKGYYWRYATEAFVDPKIVDVRRRVKAVKIDTKELLIFNSISEASYVTGANRAHISSCCLGRYGRKTANGYRFSLMEIYE